MTTELPTDAIQLCIQTAHNQHDYVLSDPARKQLQALVDALKEAQRINNTVDEDMDREVERLNNEIAVKDARIAELETELLKWTGGPYRNAGGVQPL